MLLSLLSQGAFALLFAKTTSAVSSSTTLLSATGLGQDPISASNNYFYIEYIVGIALFLLQFVFAAAFAIISHVQTLNSLSLQRDMFALLSCSCIFKIISFAFAIVEEVHILEKDTALVIHHVTNGTDLLSTFCLMCTWLVLVSFWAEQYLVHKYNRTSGQLISTEKHNKLKGTVSLVFWIIVTLMFLSVLIFIIIYSIFGLSARDIWFKVGKLVFRGVVSFCIVVGMMYFGILLWLEYRKAFSHLGSNLTRVAVITVFASLIEIVLLVGTIVATVFKEEFSTHNVLAKWIVGSVLVFLEMLNNTLLLFLFRPPNCCRNNSYLCCCCLCSCCSKNMYKSSVLKLDVHPHGSAENSGENTPENMSPTSANSLATVKSPMLMFKSVFENSKFDSDNDEDPTAQTDDDNEESKAVLKRKSSYLQIDQVPESFYYQNGGAIVVSSGAKNSQLNS